MQTIRKTAPVAGSQSQRLHPRGKKFGKIGIPQSRFLSNWNIVLQHVIMALP